MGIFDRLKKLKDEKEKPPTATELGLASANFEKSWREYYGKSITVPIATDGTRVTFNSWRTPEEIEQFDSAKDDLIGVSPILQGKVEEKVTMIVTYLDNSSKYEVLIFDREGVKIYEDVVSLEKLMNKQFSLAELKEVFCVEKTISRSDKTVEEK